MIFNFGNFENCDIILNDEKSIEKRLKKHANSKCIVCHLSYGAKKQCCSALDTCNKYFHPLCAYLYGY